MFGANTILTEENRVATDVFYKWLNKQELLEQKIAELQREIDELPAPGSIALPTGTIIQHAASSSTPPLYFLPCTGATVSREAYASLFGVIGTTYGIGDGIETFSLPDFTGQFLRGTGGLAAAPGTAQGGAAPTIYGGMGIVYGGGYTSASGVFYTDGTAGSGGGSTGTQPQIIRINANRSSGAYGRREEVAPDNYAINLFIKY